jgi:hypothetical protein
MISTGDDHARSLRPSTAVEAAARIGVVAEVKGRTGGKVKRVFQLDGEGFSAIAIAIAFETNDSTKCLPLGTSGCHHRGGPPCCSGFCDSSLVAGLGICMSRCEELPPLLLNPNDILLPQLDRS